MKAIFKHMEYGAILIALWLTGCSKTSDVQSRYTEPEKALNFTIPASIQTSAATSLNTSVYIFSSPASLNSYTLCGSIPALGDRTVYRFSNSDLSSKDYRFLFISTPAQAEISLTTISGTAPATGTKWEDVVLHTLTTAPGTDNYYAVETISGKELEAAERVTGKLSRIVGQTVYEFTRSADASSVIPADIISPDVKSVLDRIYEIEIEYSGVTEAVSFDAGGNPVPYGAAVNAMQRVTVTYDADGFKVSVPQSDRGIALPASAVKGGARIMGLCMLPCNKTVAAKLTFSYFDTTPACGNNHAAGESHSASCYDKRSMTLAIPPVGSTGLSVLRDTYTVSRIGLPCDRIIDVPETNSINISFSWNS